MAGRPQWFSSPGRRRRLCRNDRALSGVTLSETAVGKGGRDGHGCCRLGMWKEYAG